MLPTAESSCPANRCSRVVIARSEPDAEFSSHPAQANAKPSGMELATRAISSIRNPNKGLTEPYSRRSRFMKPVAHRPESESLHCLDSQAVKCQQKCQQTASVGSKME